LRGLQSKTIADFVGDLLPFRLTSGRVDLGGDYTFAVPKQGGMTLDARLPKIEARDFRLRAQGVETDWVVVPSATVTDTRLSLARRDVSIGRLQADGAQVEAWMEPDGAISLGRLFTGKVIAASKATPGEEWHVRVRAGAHRQREARAEDRTMKPAGEVRTVVGERDGRRPELRHGACGADHRDGDRQRQGAVAVGRQRRPGSVLRRPARGGLRSADARCPRLSARLSVARPAIGRRRREGAVVLRPAEAPGPELEYDGDASIAHFDLVDKASKQPFLSWARVDVGGIDYTAAPDHIAIRSIKVQRPVARVVIARDGKLNLATTLGAATPADAASARDVREECLHAAAAESRRSAARRRHHAVRRLLRATELPGEDRSAAGTHREHLVRRRAP
jgi:hypothetical protein